MAKATVTKICPTCGREIKWSTTCSNRREANSWEAWAEKQEILCTECYAEHCCKERKKAEAEKQEKVAKNPFGINPDELPLQGSPKQTAWAREIVAEFILQLSDQKPTEEGIAVISRALRTATAKEIIDNRVHSVDWLGVAVKRLESEPATTAND